MVRTLDETAHARTRERILDAARKLFAEEGYHSASMNDVAEAVRLTKAGLYHYFASKQALLETLHEEILQETQAKIEALPRFRDLREALAETGHRYLEHFRDPKHRAMMEIAFKLGFHDMEGRDAAAIFRNQRIDEQLLGLFLPYLPEGSSPVRARLFAQQYFGALFFYVFGAERLCPAASLSDPNTYLAQLVETFAAIPTAALKGEA